MNIDETTIRISKETKKRLDGIKVHKRESYEEVLQKIISILNLCKANPAAARQKLSEMDILREKLKKN